MLTMEVRRGTRSWRASRVVPVHSTAVDGVSAVDQCPSAGAGWPIARYAQAIVQWSTLSWRRASPASTVSVHPDPFEDTEKTAKEDGDDRVDTAAAPMPLQPIDSPTRRSSKR